MLLRLLFPISESHQKKKNSYDTGSLRTSFFTFFFFHHMLGYSVALGKIQFLLFMFFSRRIRSEAPLICPYMSAFELGKRGCPFSAFSTLSDSSKSFSLI